MKSRVTAADCQSCGGCCVAQYADERVYVEMTTAERNALPPHRRRLTVFNPRWGSYDVKTKVERGGSTVCAFLFGSLGERVRCGIYDARPAPCRSFKPGSPECLGSRDEIGLARR